MISAPSIQLSALGRRTTIQTHPPFPQVYHYRHSSAGLPGHRSDSSFYRSLGSAPACNYRHPIAAPVGDTCHVTHSNTPDRRFHSACWPSGEATLVVANNNTLKKTLIPLILLSTESQKKKDTGFGIAYARIQVSAPRYPPRYLVDNECICLGSRQVSVIRRGRPVFAFQSGSREPKSLQRHRDQLRLLEFVSEVDRTFSKYQRVLMHEYTSFLTLSF